LIDSALKTGKSRRLNLIVAVSAALLSTSVFLFLLVSSWNFFDQVSDLPQYVITGKMLDAGQGADIYSGSAVGSVRHELFPTIPPRSLVMLSPPPAALLFMPLGLLPASLTKLLWQPFLLLLAVAGILLLKKTYKLTPNETLWLWAICAFFGPFFEGLKIGQLNSAFLFFLCSSMYLFRSGRDLSAGAVLALFILKPQELITFGFYLLGAGRYRAIGMAVAVVTVLCLIALALIGTTGYESFWQLLQNPEIQKHVMQPELTATVRGQMTRLGLAPNIVSSVSLVCLAAAVAISFLWGRLQARSPNWLEAGIVVALPLGLLTAFLVHYYDLVMLIPVGIALIKSPISSRFPPAMVLLSMLALVVVMMPVSTMIHYDLLVSGAWKLNPFMILLTAASVTVTYYCFRYRKDWQQVPAELTT